MWEYQLWLNIDWWVWYHYERQLVWEEYQWIVGGLWIVVGFGIVHLCRLILLDVFYIWWLFIESLCILWDYLLGLHLGIKGLCFWVGPCRWLYPLFFLCWFFCFLIFWNLDRLYLTFVGFLLVCISDSFGFLIVIRNWLLFVVCRFRDCLFLLSICNRLLIDLDCLLIVLFGFLVGFYFRLCEKLHH